MAKILLNVELNSGNAQKQIKSLQSSFELMAKSLNSISVNKNLTAQMNSAARYYNAIAKAAKSATDATEKRRLVEAKIATQEAKTNTEHAKTANLLNQIKVRTDKLTESQKKKTTTTKQATQANEKHNQSLISMIPNIFKWQVAMTAVMKPLRLLQDALTSINETLVKTEDAVIALQRVLPTGSGTDSDIANKLYELAQKYGQTFENASQIATSFARAGLTWNETIKATEAALLALNVAELDATQASDGLLSIITQFGLEAGDLTEVVDKLNKTADNFPVTTEKILTALQRTGSAARNANLDLNDTIGIITALSKATNRSGQNIGTAANSLIQYSSKSSSLDIFAQLSAGSGQAVENYRTGKGSLLDVWREVAAVIDTASDRQKELLQQLADSPETQELNNELGDIFEELQDIYGTASTFRKNYFIALLDNIKTVDDAITTAGNSAGYSQKENQKYLDTYTAKVNTLKSLWEQMANDEQGLLGIKKDLVDIGTWLLKGVQALGGIKTLLIAVVSLTTTWFLLFKTQTVITFFTKLKNGITQIVAAIPEAIAAWQLYAQGVITANEAMQLSIPVIGLVLAAISALAIGIGAAKANAKSLGEQISDLKQNIQESESTLDELENKLKENNDLIDKANQLGGNDAYITRLKAENEELERQIKLQTALHKKEIEELGKAAYEKLAENSEYGYVTAQTREIDRPIAVGGSFKAPIKTGNISEAVESFLQIAESSGIIDDRLYSYFSTINEYIGNLNLEDTKQKALYDTLIKQIDRFNKLMEMQGKLQEETTDSTEKWADSLEDVVNSYKKIAEALKDVRDEKEDVYNYEQKILDVQKAQQQLEDARNNKNVRVYNAATGTWEWQANAKDVQSAEESLQQAQHNLEKAAFNQIIAQFEDQTATTKSIAEIIAKIAPLLGADSTMVSDIKSTISKVGNVNPDSLTFDKGGILSGLGGIKATSRPETVLPPDLTEKILTPSSNADFAQFAKSLGIMFGTSREVAKSSIVHNYGGNTDNSDNRSYYTVNGVPFSAADAGSKTLNELFAEAAYFKN